MNKQFFFAIIMASALAGCTKKQITADESLLGKDYYPVTQGSYIVYDVDSTVYTDLPKDTVFYKYRIKEKFTGTFTDNEGNEAFRLERYIKNFVAGKSYDSIPWTMKEVWMVNADNKSVQILERSHRYTRLIFPIQEKVTWNGNARNTLGEWIYTYDYIDRTETINGHKLEKVLYVKQKDFRTQLSYEKYYEKYAKGIGLVEKEIIDVSNNQVVNTLPVEDRILLGLKYKQTLVTFGVE